LFQNNFNFNVITPSSRYFYHHQIRSISWVFSLYFYEKRWRCFQNR